MLRTSIETGSDWAEKLAGPWEELLSCSVGATPFQTLQWQSTWWKHYGKTKSPYIVSFYEGNDMVGLMPLMRTRGLWQTLRAMATGASDYLHPLSRPGYEQRVAEALQRHIEETDAVDLVDLHQVRSNQPLSTAIQRANRIEQATCLVLDLPATYDAYLGTLGKSLRYDVRKLDKQVFSSGKAKVTPVTADTIDTGISLLMETHRKRWRKRGLPGAFSRRAESFHRDWTRQAQERGWLWLSLLEHERNTVGAIYAMRLGGTCYYYQAGFDPSAGSMSPGTLLVAYTIKRAIEEGLSTFDFLRGDEPYKRRWKPQHEYRNLRFIAPAKGILGKFGSAWNDAGSRVEGKIRARLEGRGLL